MDIETLRPWSLQPDSGTVRWDYAWGSDSDCWSLLHTAGPDNSGRVIRLHLLGPTAIIGAGPAGGGRINVGISIPLFSPRNDKIFPAIYFASFRISDPAFGSRSDLRYVPTL